MGLLSTKVEVNLATHRIQYYENLGYSIPRVKDKSGRWIVPNGTKILVDVNDLSRGSNIKVNVECDDCKKQSTLQYKQYNDTLHDGIHRCRTCYLKWQSGANHYRWNADISQEERENKRNIDGYKDFVKSVMARDNYTCQCCGKKSSRDLNAHHIDSYDWCIEKRTDVTNGITLCESCHKNFHHIYGRGNNTKEQFDEWFKKAVCLEGYNGDLQTANKIYCIEEDKVYNSSFELADAWNLNYTTSIYDACNWYRRLNGKLKERKHKTSSVLGKHLLWYEDYLSLTKEEIANYLNRIHTTQCIPVICITTNKYFASINAAGRFYGLNKKTISNCCKGVSTYGGKLQDGTKLQWMYYNEYLKQQNEINVEELESN